MAGQDSDGCSSSSKASRFWAPSASCFSRSPLLSGSLFATSSSVFSQSLSFSSASFRLAGCPYSKTCCSVSPFSFGLSSSHGDRVFPKAPASSPADLLCCLVGGRLLKDSRARVCVEKMSKNQNLDHVFKQKNNFIYKTTYNLYSVSIYLYHQLFQITLQASAYAWEHKMVPRDSN